MAIKVPVASRHTMSMLSALCGVPCAAFAAYESQVGQVLQTGGSIRARTVVLDDEISVDTFLAAPEAEPCLIVSRFPTAKLVEWLDARDVPVVLLVPDTVDAVRYEMAQGNRDSAAATRLISQSLAMLSGLRKHRNLLVQHADLDPKALLKFSTTFGKKFFSFAPLTTLSLTTQQKIEFVNEALFDVPDEELVRKCLDDIAALLVGKDEAKTFWPARFFYKGDDGATPAPRSIEMIGPARCIYYGPYMHLPAGRWSGRLLLGFTELIACSHVRVEFFVDDVLANFYATAESDGVFSMPIALEIEAPQKPIQLRIFLDAGEIAGKFWLAGVELDHHRPVSSTSK